MTTVNQTPGANATGLANSDSRILRATEEYAALVHAGETPDRELFLARYADIADALGRCLDSLDFLDAARRSLGGAMNALPAEHDLLASAQPLGDYRLIREVGHGGMGIVYEAEQLSLGRRVALKVLPFAATMDPKQLQRFRNEALAAASLRHDHIVHVYGVGCERGVHFYAMEFIDGQTLAEVIQQASQERLFSSRERQRPESSRQTPVAHAPGSTGPVAALSTKRDKSYFRSIAALIADAADALDHAHELGVVHRDIKPGNLMLDESGRIWITDFGLAKVVVSLRDTDPRSGATRLPDLTLTGDVIGTLRYTAPEQALAKHGLVDHRTDIYSLGATLYELLTLKPAVDGADKAEMLKRIAWDDPTPLRKLDKSIPAELETITLKCLAKEPGERYATAGEMAADLRRWVEEKPITARPPTVFDHVGKWAGRHRLVVSLVILFLLTTSLGLTTGIVLLQRAHQEELVQRERAKKNLRVALKALDEAIWPAFEPLMLRGSPPTANEVKPLETLLAFYDEFARQNADDRQLILETAKARLQTGLTFAAMGNHGRADREIQQATEELRALVELRPDNRDLAGQFAIALFKYGEFLHKRGRDGEAVAPLSEAVAIGEAPSTDSARSALLWVLAESHMNLGMILKDDQSRLAEAEQHFRSALKVQEQNVQRAPKAVYPSGRFAAFLNDFAIFLLNTGRPDEAEEGVRRAIPLTQGAIERERKVAFWTSNLRRHFLVLGQIAQARNRPNDYFDALKNQLSVLERMISDYPEATDSRYRAACAAMSAAACEGVDPGILDDAERGRLRLRALGWLQAELVKLANSPDSKKRQQVRSWQRDPALVSVRDDNKLGKLPEPERAAWQKLWSDVTDLLKRTKESTSAAVGPANSDGPAGLR